MGGLLAFAIEGLLPVITSAAGTTAGFVVLVYLSIHLAKFTSQILS